MPVAVTGRGRVGLGAAGRVRAPPVAAALAGRARLVVGAGRRGRAQTFSSPLRVISAAGDSAVGDSCGRVDAIAAEALRGRRCPRPPLPGGGRVAEGGLREHAVETRRDKYVRNHLLLADNSSLLRVCEV